MNDSSRLEHGVVRGVGRRTDYLEEKTTWIESPDHYQDVLTRKDEKKLILRFLRSPIELIPSESNPNHIAAVKL